ncbi:hypothetical protein Bbelb_086830 [Branchiostoma belcheri]|nr:hypothetical protein Bbelb_086830 [Branchiostoma belcheri]
MNPTTLSALLLVTVCCFILVEVAVGEDNSATAEFDSPDFLMDKKAIRGYIKRADNKANAIQEIHSRMVATGLKKRAKKFMKKEHSRMKKYQQKLKHHQRGNEISRRPDQRSARGNGGNARRGYGGYRLGRGYGFRG